MERHLERVRMKNLRSRRNLFGKPPLPQKPIIPKVQLKYFIFSILKHVFSIFYQIDERFRSAYDQKIVELEREVGDSHSILLCSLVNCRKKLKKY